MINSATTNALWARISVADERYGDFASTHEAIGVGAEEWHELLLAIHANDRAAIMAEALDMAAVLIRLHDQLMRGGKILERSGLLISIELPTDSKYDENGDRRWMTERRIDDPL